MLEQLASSLGFANPGSPPELSHRQRIELMLDGELVDRPPVCFWHHFQPAGNGRTLARQTYEFFVGDYDLDIVKIMPDLPYPFPRKSIASIDDWRLIEPIDPQKSPWVQQQVECIKSLGSVAPRSSDRRDHVQPTHQSPLFYPEYRAVPGACAAIPPRSFIRHWVLLQRIYEVRPNSSFVPAPMASSSRCKAHRRRSCPSPTYREFGRPYDFLALRGAQSAWFNILHLHGARRT